MVEEWRDIVIVQDGVLYDFTGYYQVSRDGKVRSVRKNILISQHPTHNGYLRVKLYKRGVKLNCRVNRLVAFAFLPIPEGADVNKLDANHLNEVVSDNRVENLDWRTRKENINYGSANERRAKTLGKKVICIDTGISYNSVADAHRKTGINYAGISKCCRGLQETCKGCCWKFLKDYIREINETNESLVNELLVA